MTLNTKNYILPALEIGQVVRVQHKHYPWRKAKVISQTKYFVILEYLRQQKEPRGGYRECFFNDDIGKVVQI